MAIFNRASEGTGNEYWQAQPSVDAAANAMLATEPAQDYFGDSLDTDWAFIEHIYLNTLNKTAAEDDDDPAVEGDIFTLTADTDDMTGTADNDFFEAPITQNSWAGGVSNSLSTADRLDGDAGTDTLHAELVPEFFGVTGDNQMDVQPRIESIEDIKFEAMDFHTPGATVIVDAKNIKDVDKIGSFFSDGDLVIENLTTLTGAGDERNTDTITITMDHTDNFNTDGDASDLDVYFDEDYLLSGESSEYTLELRIVNAYEMAENDAPLTGFSNIDFTVGTQEVVVDISAETTYAGVINAIDSALTDAGITGVTTTAQPERTAIFTDDIDAYNQGDTAGTYTPVLLTSNNLELARGTITLDSDVEDFNGLNTWIDGSTTDDNPVAINVELHKVGRDNDGGDLFIGGKHDEGIPDIYVDVLGEEDKPSNLGSINTNTNDLENVYISTHADYVAGETFASLTVRDGFDDQASVDLVDADDFLGDLTLGSVTAVADLVTLWASGGGDVNFTGDVDADGNAYSYTTGSGNDTFVIDLDGDAVDTNDESVTISTGGGVDSVTVDDTSADPQAGVSQRTMQILENLTITTGSGEDYVEINNNFRFDITAGSDSDFVYIDSEDTAPAATGTWTVGTATGPATFASRVLYQADMTVTFAGFESTVAVETDSTGNFVADQVTINTAIMAAIEANPELDRLLTVTPGTAHQQLIITSNVDGVNELAIDLYQPQLVAAGDPTGAGAVNLATADVTPLLTGIIATDAAEDSLTDPLAYVNANWGSLNADGTVGTAALWDGEPVNLVNSFIDAARGADAVGPVNVNFSVINMGSGANDLVALDSNDNSANILEIDQTFGKVSVVNFFDNAALTVVGNHALDYTTYLNNQTDDTDNDDNLSADPVAVTLDTVLDPTTAASIEANQVKMISLAETATETFDGLTASALVTALNGDGTADDNYANINNAINAAASTTDLVGNVQNHIFMVENANNLGEYKVFHLTSTIDADTGTTAGEFDTSAVELGVLDFGNSINFGLVGDPTWEADYAALIAAADGVAPPDDTTAPTLVSTDPADNATDVAANTDIVMTFNEDVQAGTGAISVFNAADDSLVEAVPAGNATYAGATVTVDLAADLALSSDYYVRVQPGAIEDLAGNPFAGFANPEALNFTSSADEPPVGHEFDATVAVSDLGNYEAGDGDYLFTFDAAGTLKFVNINEFDAGDSVELQAANADVDFIDATGTSIEMAFGEIVGGDSWFVTFSGVDAILNTIKNCISSSYERLFSQAAKQSHLRHQTAHWVDTGQ